MERFCKVLKVHATKIIQYEKKEMTRITDEKIKTYKNQKVCFICKKRFSTDDDNKKYHKNSEIIVINEETVEELLILFVI